MQKPFSTNKSFATLDATGDGRLIVEKKEIIGAPH